MIRFLLKTDQCIAAGDVVMRPMFAPEGMDPGCNLESRSGHPHRCQNVKLLRSYHWVMGDLTRHIEYVLGQALVSQHWFSAQELPEMADSLHKKLPVRSPECLSKLAGS